MSIKGFVSIMIIGLCGMSEGMEGVQLSPESRCYKLYGMSSSSVGDIAMTTYSKEKAQDLVKWLWPVRDTKDSKILYIYGISGYETQPDNREFLLDIIQSAKDGFWPAIEFLMSNFGLSKGFLEKRDVRSILSCIG